MKERNDMNMTVEVWIRNWQRTYRSYIKESTFATYSVAIENHILPYFGKRQIKDIRHDDNQEFILFLSQKRKKTARDIWLLRR